MFSEKDSEEFKDQHGINFKRVHLHDYKENTTKSVSFSYDNPTGEISINKLQTMLSTDDQLISPSTPNVESQVPIRHKLPLWQPLAILGLVSLTIGWMFSVNTKKGISFVEFSSSDVVRHSLVKKIISAYSKNEKKEKV